MEKKIRSIEYFILDDELLQIAEENNLKKLDEYKKKYPGEEEIIDQGVVLMQNLKISHLEVTQEQIENDHKKLFDEIKRRKRRTISLWWSAAGVACACMILFTVLRAPLSDANYNDKAFSMLESMNNKGIDEVQIISGTTKMAVVEKNDVIKQTEEGDILVGKEKKVKSADMDASFVQLVVPNGKRTSIMFNDGTVAWLNSGSKLVYPKTFSKDKREVFIEGEIYLEVKKDKSRPFLVHTKKFDVTVLGTRFNISAYAEDREHSVVLVEGSVEVNLAENKTKLSPNNGFFYDGSSVNVKHVDTSTYTSWKDGIMKVNGESLENIFVRLSRQYNVQIKCADQDISKERYKGKLNLYESIDEVLYNLSLSTPFNLEKKENTIVISKK